MKDRTLKRWTRHTYEGVPEWGVYYGPTVVCPACGERKYLDGTHIRRDTCPASRSLTGPYVVEVYKPTGYLERDGEQLTRRSTPTWAEWVGCRDHEDAVGEAELLSGYHWTAVRVRDRESGEVTMVHDERAAEEEVA